MNDSQRRTLAKYREDENWFHERLEEAGYYDETNGTKERLAIYRGVEIKLHRRLEQTRISNSDSPSEEFRKLRNEITEAGTITEDHSYRYAALQGLFRSHGLVLPPLESFKERP